jgi:hypothetical protein
LAEDDYRDDEYAEGGKRFFQYLANSWISHGL